MPTVEQIITQIAPVSEILASNDISNGQLYGSPLNPMWAIQIYIETQSCKFRYEQEDIANGAEPSQQLIANANYLYSIICGKYGQVALGLINSGGLLPVDGGGGGGSTGSFGELKVGKYKAVSEGETSFSFPLPTGSIVWQAFKGVTQLEDTQYSYVNPLFSLLGGISLSVEAEEEVFISYIKPLV